MGEKATGEDYYYTNGGSIENFSNVETMANSSDGTNALIRTKNVGGIVTVYAVGQKPANDYTIQVTITEVRYG